MPHMLTTKTRSRYMICYDISNDKRRRQLVKCLDDYGQRVQYSVYEALLSKSKLEEMKKRLDEIADYDQDSINLYFLSSECEEKIERKGTSKYVEPYDEPFLLL